jgi:HPt (histidine-containing phosphotransfer) domain-containing protein
MAMALRNDVVRAAREAGTAKPVDLVHLSNLTMGDRELEREVLGMFLAHSDIYVTTWKAARSDQARKQAAHALKGAARGIGAWQLAEIAEKAEGRGFSGRAALETEMQRVCDYIRSLD